MVQIVFDARMIAHSGIGTYSRAILSRILEEYECTLLGDKSLLESLLELPYPTKIIDFQSDIYTLGEQLSYLQKIPESMVFWSPHYNVPYLNIKSKKRLVTIHDMYHMAAKDGLGPIKKAYANIFLKKSARKSDKIITVSNFSKNEIIKYTGVDGQKISVIHNSVYREPQKDTGEKSGIDFQNETYILYVGNVKPHKNLINLVKAFESLEKKRNIKLMIVGKKEGFITSDDRVLKYAAKNRNIIFTGYLSSQEIVSAYKNAEALVFPSLYEGFGYPLIEAMKYKTPVICSNIEVFKEIAADAAIYFDPYDIVDISEKIDKTLDSQILMNKLSLKGEEYVSSKYAYEHFVQKHRNVLNSLL